MCAKSTSELTVPEHFYRGPRSSCWYVRLVAPDSIRHLVPSVDYRRSTGHSDLHKAKVVGAALISEKRREWDSLALTVAAGGGTGRYAMPTTLTPQVIEKICAAWLYAVLKDDDDERLDGLTDEQLQAMEQYCTLTDQAMRSVLSQGPASSQWPELVTTLLQWSETCGHVLDHNDPLLPRLVRDFASVEKKAVAQVSARNRGEHLATPEAPDYRVPTLSSLTEQFREFKAQKSQRPHVDACVHAWKLFVAHAGDITFDAVTASHLFQFLHDQMRAKVKPWSEKRALGFGKGALREAFGLARTSGLMTAPNPVDAMDIDPGLPKEEDAKHLRPRHPFTDEQLSILFTSGWYDPSNTTDFRGKLQADLGARYWVPLLGLCHGNRVREALQLAVSDVSTEDGVILLSFQTELELDGDFNSATDRLAKLRTLKNKATQRVVPVHPQLVSLGFGEFLEERRAEGPNALLFPSSLPEPGGMRPKLGRAYEQAFLRYVRDRLAFGHGYGSHSFRHQLEDRIRAAQGVQNRWPPGLAQRYVGRKRTRDVDRDYILSEGSEVHYGKGYPAKVMREWISTLNFNRLTMPVPYRDWLQLRLGCTDS